MEFYFTRRRRNHAGHMGEKRTIVRITERYMWTGVVKDVKKMVI